MNDTLDTELKRIATAMTDEAPEAPDEVPTVGLQSGSVPVGAWRGVRVALGTAAVVVLILGGLFLLNPPTAQQAPSETPSSTEGTAVTTSAATVEPIEVPPASLVDQAELGEPLLWVDGGAPQATLVDLGDALAIPAAETAHVSLDSGSTWTATAPLPNGDVITELAGSDRILLAIGAKDGSGARLYVSHDRGDTWQSIDLPAPDGVTQSVPHKLAIHDGKVLLAGAGTTSTFDNDTRVYLWRSAVSDGDTWTVDEVAQMGSDFTFTEAIVWVGSEPVVLAQTFSDRVLAFEHNGGSWRTIDVGEVIANQAAIGPEMGNITLTGTNVIDTELFVWWRFEDNAGGSTAAVMARRSGELGWEARRDVGPDGEQTPIPDYVLSADGAYIAIGHAETPRGMPATSSSILVSQSGLGWAEIARINGLDLTSLVALDATNFITVGNETREFDSGGSAWTALGVWPLELTDPITDLLSVARLVTLFNAEPITPGELESLTSLPSTAARSGYRINQVQDGEIEYGMIMYTDLSEGEGIEYTCFYDYAAIGGIPVTGGSQCAPTPQDAIDMATFGIGLSGACGPIPKDNPQIDGTWMFLTIWGLPDNAATVEVGFSDGTSTAIEVSDQHVAQMLWQDPQDITSVSFDGATADRINYISSFTPATAIDCTPDNGSG